MYHESSPACDNTSSIYTTGALSLVELGTMIPSSGAEYPYIRAGMGDLMAFFYAWMNVFVLRPGQVAIICQVFSTYVIQPIYQTDWFESPFIPKDSAETVLTVFTLC